MPRVRKMTNHELNGAQATQAALKLPPPREEQLDIGALERWKGQFIPFNASQYFRKEKPKNVLTDAGTAAAAGAYHAWETRPKLSKVVALDEVRKADYNLSPSQFVEVGDRATHRDLADILADPRTAREERERADGALAEVLERLGLEA